MTGMNKLDLLVQVLPDDCIKRLLNEDWDSLNNMEQKTVLSLFQLKANVKRLVSTINFEIRIYFL